MTRFRRSLAAWACLGGLAAGCGPRPADAPVPPDAPAPTASPIPGPPPGPPWFRDATAGSGVAFTCRTGAEADRYTILESLGGGVGLLDYDGDGRLDVFLAGGGYFDGPGKATIRGAPCRLYRNLGGWKFRDVTAEVGLDREWFYSHGVAVADYDRDGWPDLLVTGYGRVALFRNEPGGPGGRRFADVTAAVGLADGAWATSAGWADLDGDGFPDLYVCHYVDWSPANDPACPAQAAGAARDVCPPQRFKPLAHALFRNEGGKKFADASAAHRFAAAGAGLGVVLADLDGDARPDVYVANDGAANFLYWNRGGRLEEGGWAAGVALDDTGRYNGSMGTDVGDYDGSGRPSVWVTNFQGDMHALYRNLGRGAFDYQSQAAGVAAVGTHLVGFGTAFADLDGDGWEDLVFVNGHVLRHPKLGSPVRQKPVLLRNVDRGGRRYFADYSARGGAFFAAPALGRGLALGDLDNDGRPDLVVSHADGPAALLRNEVGGDPAPAAWVGVRLAGRDRRDAAGSTVQVQTDARTLTRFARGGGSYLSSGDRRLLFGLAPGERVKKVTVRWAWGEEQTWDGLEPGAYWELAEGRPAAARLAAPN